MKQALILDLDGTLIDSESVSLRIWNDVLSQFGHAMNFDFYRQLVGHSVHHSLDRIIEMFALTISPTDLLALANAQWERSWRAGMPPMPGVFELADALDEAGILWGVATASELAYAEGTLDALGLLSRAGAIAAGDEVPHNKPAPDVYLLAARRLGVAPHNCLAIEDSAPGHLAAYAAQMTVGVVPNALTRDTAFQHATYRFENLSALIPELPNLFNVGQGAGAPDSNSEFAASDTAWSHQ